MQVTFTGLSGQSQTVDADKAAQLAAYIAKQIVVCQDSIRACIAIKDMVGKAKYETQIKAMSAVCSQIDAQLA